MTEPADTTGPESNAAAMLELVAHMDPIVEACAGLRSKCLGCGFPESVADAGAGEMLVQMIRFVFAKAQPTPTAPSWLMDLLGKRR